MTIEGVILHCIRKAEEARTKQKLSTCKTDKQSYYNLGQYNAHIEVANLLRQIK